jgi:hypothetical protein
LPVEELYLLLQRFYATVRTQDWKEYFKSALVGLRAAVNRHLTSLPVSRNVNIMNDRAFMGSDQVLSGLIKTLKREGKDISKHKEQFVMKMLKNFTIQVYSLKILPKHCIIKLFIMLFVNLAGKALKV